MGVGKNRFFFLSAMAQAKKEQYFMISTLTEDRTLSSFVYRAVKKAILVFRSYFSLDQIY